MLAKISHQMQMLGRSSCSFVGSSWAHPSCCHSHSSLLISASSSFAEASVPRGCSHAALALFCTLWCPLIGTRAEKCLCISICSKWQALEKKAENTIILLKCNYICGIYTYLYMYMCLCIGAHIY